MSSKSYVIVDLFDTMSLVMQIAKRLDRSYRTDYVMELANEIIDTIIYANNHSRLAWSIITDYGSTLKETAVSANRTGKYDDIVTLLLECSNCYVQEMQANGLEVGDAEITNYALLDFRTPHSPVLEIIDDKRYVYRSPR